ncbi:MAG: Gfo/Idh/MocA family oxidoreductase [Firmicutes bacterium]|nr:Gfo/Idh/MocA family oxidoreductase [Bacillota bacterium]
MSTKIRIAIISFAHNHAHAWSKAIIRSGDAELIGIWDDNENRGREAAQKYDTRYYSELDKLLSLPQVDAVGICAENNKHSVLTNKAAEADKHILCEKPMATNLEGCDRMIEAINKAGVTYMQCFPKRFDPVYIKIKEILQEGTLGKIGTVRMRHGHYFALEENWMNNKDAEWFRKPDVAGGGAFFDEGIHAADILRWLLGEPVSVQATIDNILVSMDVDDNGAAIWRFKEGIIAIQQSNWTDLAATNTLEIYGENGVIIQKYSDCSSTRFIGEMSIPLMIYHKDKPMKGWEKIALPVHFPAYHETVPIKFIECLKEGRKPYITAEDGRKAVEMMIGAYQASREERTIYFPLKHKNITVEV